eukprot:7489215-Prorocentrum_lima.AAC.1
MTSSLVGSEMCIRDRWRPHPDTPPIGVPPANRPPTKPTTEQRPDDAPVSYTHLTLPTICSV